MYRVKRLYILAGVLALTCAAAVWALHQEERQEQIASSGEERFFPWTQTVWKAIWTRLSIWGSPIM